jgi:RNA polymerase sigma-70 factor, ECF subfamily
LIDRRRGALERETDSERVLVLARTDQAAFAVLVRRYQSLVFSIGYHFLSNGALAEETAQEVFLDVYRNLHKIESAAHLQWWLRRTTLNRCIDQSRSAAYRSEVALQDVAEPAREDAQHDPLAGESLRRWLQTLPETQRAVVILRYQEDLEPAEIAETLGIPVNTVKSSLQRGIKSLRERMASPWQEAKR